MRPASRSARSRWRAPASALLYVEEDRYRLLARNMTDVITRHGRNGAVQFVSPAAEPLFGAPVGELLGHGLFDRVHVADRPAYLTALVGCGARRRSAQRSNSACAAIRRERAGPISARFHLGRDALPSARPGRRQAQTRASAKWSR